MTAQTQMPSDEIIRHALLSECVDDTVPVANTIANLVDAQNPDTALKLCLFGIKYSQHYIASHLAVRALRWLEQGLRVVKTGALGTTQEDIQMELTRNAAEAAWIQCLHRVCMDDATRIRSEDEIKELRPDFNWQEISTGNRTVFAHFLMVSRAIGAALDSPITSALQRAAVNAICVASKKMLALSAQATIDVIEVLDRNLNSVGLTPTARFNLQELHNEATAIAAEPNGDAANSLKHLRRVAQLRPASV